MGRVIDFPPSKTVPVVFDLDELWILQSVIRHEQARSAEFAHFPPWGIDFNDAICAAIVFCEDQKQKEATLSLSRGDLLAIDYNVNPFAKNALGKPVGKDILLKAMRARMALRDEHWGPTQEPDDEQGKRERLARWRVRQKNEAEDASS